MRFQFFFSVSLHRLHIEASHSENTDSFCAAENRMYINYISPIHSGMRALGNSKTGLDDFDRMLFASTSSMRPSPGMVCADAIRLKAEITSGLISLSLRRERSSERAYPSEAIF